MSLTAALVVLMEGEVWPNFLAACADRPPGDDAATGEAAHHGDGGSEIAWFDGPGFGVGPIE